MRHQFRFQIRRWTEPTVPDSSKTLSVPRAALEAVPPFLAITLELRTPITDKDAVGTLIEAKSPLTWLATERSSFRGAR
jgi:hypothetical protein